MTTHNEDPLVPVHSCWGDSDADIVVSFLHSRGIYAEASPQGPRSAFPFSVDGLGEIQILVEQSAVDGARSALAERERGETSIEE
jgi:hypothetical protein